MLFALLRTFAAPMLRRVLPLSCSGTVFVFLFFFVPFSLPGKVQAADATFASDIFSAPGSGLSSTGQLPLLTILYNGMTLGELHPCPTCGSAAYGGLARRAGFFNRYRDFFIPRLIVAGPYEFLPDNPFLYGIHAKNKNALPPAENARVALAAYNLLDVDIGWLSKKSAQWMHHNAGGIPRGFVEVRSEPVIRLLNSPVGTLGFVLFPEGPEPGRSPTAKQIDAAVAAGKSLKDTTVMVVGISPWGYVGERDFLPKAQGIFDCILGGGEGVGFPATVPQKTPGVLWIRPDGAGRAVNTLELYSKPQPGQKIEWIEGKTFGASLEFLGSACPPDPAMLRVVGAPPSR